MHGLTLQVSALADGLSVRQRPAHAVGHYPSYPRVGHSPTQMYGRWPDRRAGRTSVQLLVVTA